MKDPLSKVLLTIPQAVSLVTGEGCTISIDERWYGVSYSDISQTEPLRKLERQIYTYKEKPVFEEDVPHIRLATLLAAIAYVKGGSEAPRDKSTIKMNLEPITHQIPNPNKEPIVALAEEADGESSMLRIMRYPYSLSVDVSAGNILSLRLDKVMLEKLRKLLSLTI